jgi:hypothetical protein
MKACERIESWVRKNFNARHAERVTADLVDVATGNRAGNDFERSALARIFPDWGTPPALGGRRGA